MFAASKTASVSGGYQISRSLRFNSADSAYLNRTPASAGNRRTWTWSAWIKRSALGVTQQIFSSRPTSSPYALIYFASETLNYAETGLTLTTTQVFRDVSAWYHIVIATDTTQATASDRLKFYVNGVQVTSFSTATYPSQNYDTQINTATQHNLSGAQPYGAEYFTGYMTEVNFIDGQALTPSSFGETNAQTGVWQPKAYSGSYGTNGFYLNFSDNSNTTAATLGKDYSGNGNNWTPNNFSVTAGAGNDSLVDSPTSYGTDTGVGGTVRGNYATFNPLVKLGTSNLLNGNLDSGSTSPNNSTQSTIAVTSGKWYAEFAPSGQNYPRIGIQDVAETNNNMVGSLTISWGGYNKGELFINGTTVYDGSQTSPVISYTAGDIIGIAIDAGTRKVWFSKNGTWQNFSGSGADPVTGTNPVGTLAGSNAIAYAVRSESCTVSANFGQRPFAYTAPSGFKALCTQNLPTPTIGATTATQATQYFTPVLYTGNGSNGNAITVGFQPDWTWLKGRSNAQNHGLFDAVRGAGKGLQSNSTGAEYNLTDTLNSFNANGFTVNNDSTFNGSGYTYVAWNWKANGSGSTNTAGSITSTVSANTTSGFSVVTWTGNATDNASVGHGLGVAPKMVIIKNRSVSAGWPVYTNVIDGSMDALYLNLTDAKVDTGRNQFTSSVFYVSSGTDTNGSGNSLVAYCFAEISGYSKFGSYNGTGSADGPFIYTGFRPAYVMYKGSSTSGGAWDIHDAARSPRNVAVQTLFANTSGAEGGIEIDILSNGFKIRDTSANANSSGVTYIYAAFAEAPLKFALAR